MNVKTSKLASLMQKQQMLAQLEQEVEAMQKDEALKDELKFKKEFEALLDKHNKTLDDVVALYESTHHQAHTTTPQGRTKKQRPLKVYKNPHTGEVVKCRGANHKTIRQWKEEYGEEEVGKWIIG